MSPRLNPRRYLRRSLKDAAHALEDLATDLDGLTPPLALREVEARLTDIRDDLHRLDEDLVELRQDEDARITTTSAKDTL